MNDSVIIERPDKQGRLRRIVSLAATFLVWACWTYLWLPVIPWIDYVLEAGLHHQRFVVAGWRAVGVVLPTYVLIVMLIGGLIVGWALYNYIRFRKLERRKPRPRVELDELAAYSGFTLDEVTAWQHAARVVFAHDNEGRLAGVRVIR